MANSIQLSLKGFQIKGIGLLEKMNPESLWMALK